MSGWPDGTLASLLCEASMLHEVGCHRFLSLLELRHGANPQTSAAIAGADHTPVECTCCG
jgi:hypothetical protein